MTAGELRVAIANELPPLHVEHTFAAGGTTAVVGPNGAGKTTLLRIIAGLLDAGPDSTIRLGDRDFREDHRFVPAHRRGVALLGQDARLFPHLTVRANVAFAPAAAHLSRGEIRERVHRWLDAAEVSDLADRKPHQLSGGQAQRVAIARSLAAEPPILLLDEPFRALDVDVAGRLRALLRDLLSDRARTTVIVTHDVVDAVGVADEILVLDAGRVVESGPTLQVLTRPSTTFTAALSGLNFVSGRYRDGAVVTDDGARVAGTAAEALGDGQPVAAAFSPRAVAVYLDTPHTGSPRTTLPGTVIEVSARGEHAVVRTACGDHIVSAEVTWPAVTELGLARGRPVVLVIKASEIPIYAARS